MSSQRKTAIVTGASQGIGAGIVHGLVARGFNVVANSRQVTQSTEVTASDHVALVDGHIGERATAATIVETALARVTSIDALVNNAGISLTKPGQAPRQPLPQPQDRPARPLGDGQGHAA